MKHATIKTRANTYRLTCDVKECMDRLDVVCLVMCNNGKCPELKIRTDSGKKPRIKDVYDEVMFNLNTIKIYPSKSGD